MLHSDVTDKLLDNHGLADSGAPLFAGAKLPSPKHSSQRTFSASFKSASKARHGASSVPSSSHCRRRRQQVVELTISRTERALWLRSSEPGFQKRVDLPTGVSILSILPEALQGEDGSRRFLLFPGGAVPGLEIVMSNARNARRVVRLDPITGVASVVQVER